MNQGGGHFQLLDWIVLIGYFVFTMGIGLYFYRKTRSTEGFTAANRALPGWLCGLSIFATFLSSISYLALPGKSFSDNWNPFVFSLSIPLVVIVASRYFLPYYRRSGEVSAYAALEHRFGLWARIYGSVFYLLTQLARIGVVLYLMALPMQVIFGWNIYTILVITGVCVTFYSFIGGIVAVIWTDAIQAVVLMAGAVICLVVMLNQTPGGVAHVVETAVAHNKFSLGSMGASLAEPTFWVVLLYGIANNLQNFGVDQSYVQRYIAASTDREARRSVLIGGLLYVPMSALFFFIGTTLFVYYGADAPLRTANAKLEKSDSSAPQIPTTASSDIDEVRHIVARQKLLQEGLASDDPSFAARQAELAETLSLAKVGDRVFPHFIAKHLPPGLTGLLIAAVFAAAMSTVSTSLNSSATLVMSDYYKRLFRPQAAERELMIVLYATTLVWGAVGTGLSLLMVQLTENVLDVWWALAGIFGGGITGLFLLGFLSRRATSSAAAVGVGAGVVGLLWLSAPEVFKFLEKLPTDWALQRMAKAALASKSFWLSPFHTFMTPVFGTLIILFVGMVASRLFKPRPAPQRPVAD